MSKSMENDQLLMRRCFDLARLGKGKVHPNPMVGSVLLNGVEVIGEGWHKQYGHSHAEVNCLKSVTQENQRKIPVSTLFVSLEPCCFHGKTPACSDLIIQNNIKRLRISTTDKTPQVNGQGLDILKAEGVDIKTNILEKTGDWIVRFRTLFVTKKRPYIILKFAVSKDGFLGQPNKNIWLTNPISKRLVHKWRSEVGAIMVGTNTALTDNPKLDNRYFYGSSPLRIVPDRHQKIPANAALKDGAVPTWILGPAPKQPAAAEHLQYLQLPEGATFLPALFDRLATANINTLLVEGGAALLQGFIEAGYWDEARIFETDKVLGDGIAAPDLKGKIGAVEQIGSDRLVYWYNEEDGLE